MCLVGNCLVLSKTVQETLQKKFLLSNLNHLNILVLAKIKI